MTLPSKIGLEEYARQCTLQRRRYEDCRQAQQSGMADERRDFEDNQSDRYTEQDNHSCMVELLELPVHSLDWDDESSVIYETRKAVVEDDQWRSDRLQRSHQSISHSTGRNAHPVSYSAP
jgi:hypothetical protein